MGLTKTSCVAYRSLGTSASVGGFHLSPEVNSLHRPLTMVLALAEGAGGAGVAWCVRLCLNITDPTQSFTSTL